MLLKILCALPRTVYFNLKYFPFKVAVKLPVWIAPNVHIKKMWRGGIQLKFPAFNRVHIGFHLADAVDCVGAHTILNINRGGIWKIEDDAHIGRGAIISVGSQGILSVDKNFAISGTTSIVCSNKIEIGKDVQFSWNSLVMDSDAHKIYREDGMLLNPAGTVTIGNKVWIAANTTILKNSKIGNNCVVAGNSLVNKPIQENNCIVAGVPAFPKKKISRWEI